MTNLKKKIHRGTLEEVEVASNTFGAIDNIQVVASQTHVLGDSKTEPRAVIIDFYKERTQ